MRCARDSAKQHDLARAVPYQGAELILVQERPRSAGAGGIGVGDDDRDGHVLTGHEPVCGDLDQSWLSRLLAALTPLPLGIVLRRRGCGAAARSEEHTSELQSRGHLVCRLLLEKKN